MLYTKSTYRSNVQATSDVELVQARIVTHLVHEHCAQERGRQHQVCADIHLWRLATTFATTAAAATLCRRRRESQPAALTTQHDVSTACKSRKLPLTGAQLLLLLLQCL
jgi:hypothetical protein